MTRSACRSLFVFAFVLLFAPLLVSAQGDPASDTVAEPAAAPAAFTNRLRLTVDAPIGPLALGDEAALTIVVANPGAEAVENVLLYLPQERGVEWVEPAGGPWLQLGALAAGESRTTAARVRVAAMPRSGYLRFFVGATGDDAKPQRERVSLLVPRDDAETATAPAAGGEVAFAHGRVRLVFPAGWNEQDAQVTFQLEELYRQRRRERGRLLLFTIEATATGAPVESFDAPVAVTLALGDLRAGDDDEPTPAASTAPAIDENWTAIEADFDPAAGTLAFTTTDLAAYQATTDPELWRLVYNPPGASAYSGSATYSYPIELPPGIGGLTPDLSLSYSSRAAEGLTYPAMSQGFGAGWALPQAQINNGNSGLMYGDKNGGCSGYGNWRFTLVLGGVTYYLQPQSNGVSGERSYGRYEAVGSPELFIEYVADDNDENDTANVSGEFWRLRTADGVTYTFGRTADAEQVVWPVSMTTNCNGHQPRNKAFSAYNWKLDSITDVHGNRVVYTYAHACGRKDTAPYADRGENREGGGFQCSKVDVSVETVGYNFNGATAQTTATFTYQEVNEGVRRKAQSMTAGVLRPATLEVKQGATRVAKYDFTYEGDAHWFPDWPSSTEFWWLTSITRRGTGTAALPIQSFTYGQNTSRGCHSENGVPVCVELMTVADNGYGGVTRISYAPVVPDTEWLYVAGVETWDGVAHSYSAGHRPQTRLKYTPSANRVGGVVQYCYDKPFDANNNPCHSQIRSDQNSEALIGFNTTTIETQTPAAAAGSDWTTLNKTTLTFYNDNFWLLGKTDLMEQFAADGGKLSRSDYNWIRPDGAKPYVFLEWEAHATYEPGDVNTYVSNTTAYSYYAIDPGSGQFGGLKQKVEKDETGAVYRCTEYAYVSKTDGTWLINRPAREVVRGPKVDVTDVCAAGEVVAETLYRYALSQFPGDTTLDNRGLLTHILRWDGAGYVRETLTYSDRGLVTDVVTYELAIAGGASEYEGAERSRITTTYSTLGQPTSVISSGADAKAESRTLAYEPARPWLVNKVTDANGLVTEYEYDPFGRLKKVIGPGDTTQKPTVKYDYYDTGSVLLLKPLVVGVFYREDLRDAERLFYDGLGRLVQTQTAGVEVQTSATTTAQQDVVVTIAYDARGLEVCRTAPYGFEPPYVYNGQTPFKSAACDTKPRTTTTYDALGRARRVTTPDGATTRTEYHVSTTVNVSGHSRFLWTPSYDGNNHRVDRFSDVFGRLVMVREYTGDTWVDGAPTEYAAYADTRYGYDALDNLTLVRASKPSDALPGDDKILRDTTMTYGRLGRKVEMTDADMGMWTYVYDAAGNLIRQQAGAGNALCFYYDGFNRPLRRIIDPDTGESCLSYDDSPSSGTNHLASYRYGLSKAAFNIGRPVEVGWGSAPSANKDTFAYDNQGRLKWQRRTVNGQPFELGRENEPMVYDALDRPTSVKYPDGNTLTTTYDQEGVETLTAGGAMLIDAVGYNERGQLTFLGRKETAQTPTVPDTTLSYYSAGEDAFRLSGIANNGAAAFPDFSYGGYDAAGNLTAFIVGSTNYGYGYDEFNRLKTVTGAITRTYTYDRLGNFDTVTRAGVTWDYSYAPNNDTRLMGVTNLPLTVQSYDARGNLAQYTKSGVAYELTFDVENRLASVKVGTGQPTTFAYDADGQRVMTTYPDGTVVYTPFPDYEVTDPPTGANVTRTTYRLGGQIAAIHVNDGATNKFYYPLTDHLGNVIALSDVDGNFVSGSDARYDPFGAFTTTPATNPTISNHGFTGHRHNNTGANNLGLIYMNARYYLPEVGRFISPDLIVPEPGNPQSYNRYIYTLNNPIKYNDPSGHWFESVLDLASIAYDIYDIRQNGLNWTNGLSLAADVGSLALPVVTGGGLAVRAWRMQMTLLTS